jgi:hypothetical protein
MSMTHRWSQPFMSRLSDSKPARTTALLRSAKQPRITLMEYYPHMALEEASLLPLACRHLSGEDWVEIGVAFGANGDPRFTGDAEAGFADLFRRIVALAAPGRPDGNRNF